VIGAVAAGECAAEVGRGEAGQLVRDAKLAATPAAATTAATSAGAVVDTGARIAGSG